MFRNNDFMNYMGYRNSLLEEKISQCLNAINRGETSITIDCGDLTDDEIEYIKSEVQRRAGR